MHRLCIVDAAHGLPTISTTVTELPESRVRVEARGRRRRGRAPARAGRAARSAARCASPASARARSRRRSSSSASAARRCSTRRCASSLGRWYSAAIDDARDRARSASPQLDLGDLPGEGEPLTLLDRDRRAADGDARRVQGPRGRPARADVAPTRRSTRELERAARAHGPARDRRAPAASAATSWSWTSSARSTASRSRAARAATSWSSSARAGSCPGFEEQLEGATAGEERTVEVTFPDDYGAERPGRQGRPQFAVTVKEVKGKELPGARRRLRRRRRASTRSTSCASDIRARLARGRARSASRPSSARRRSTPPSPTRPSTCPTRWSRRAPASCGTQMLHSLSHQGISQGGLPADLRQGPRRRSSRRRKPDAERALRREAVLAAIVEAEGIEPTDDELLEALEAARRARGHVAEEAAGAPALRGPARGAARRPRARARRSTCWSRRPSAIPVEQAQAREKLWTPGAGRAPARGQLWTPGIWPPTGIRRPGRC